MILGHQLAAKIYTRTAIAQEPLIAIFHDWIRRDILPGHLLIDVADYRHVPNGPGVMIIGHQAQFGADEGTDGHGLLYTRRRDEPGELAAKVREVLSWTAHIALLLEREAEFDTAFDPNRIRVMIRSRLTYDDRAIAARDLESAVTSVAEKVWSTQPAITQVGEASQLAAVDADGRGGIASVADLAARLDPVLEGGPAKKLNVL